MSNPNDLTLKPNEATLLGDVVRYRLRQGRILHGEAGQLNELLERIDAIAGLGQLDKLLAQMAEGMAAQERVGLATQLAAALRTASKLVEALDELEAAGMRLSDAEMPQTARIIEHGLKVLGVLWDEHCPAPGERKRRAGGRPKLEVT